MTGSEKQTVHFTANCTVLLAFFVALFFPIGYFAISYQYAVGSLETEAEINARIISGLGDLAPGAWHSEAHRLDALLSHHSAPAHKEKHRILDSVGNELAASGNDPDVPVIRRTHPVRYGDKVIGSVEISRSLRPILKRSLLVTVLGLGVALIVFILLPFRAINRANRQLQDSYNFLRKVMESSANALIVLNLDGTIGMVNGRCTETSGYTPEELIGRGIPEMVCPESSDMVIGQLHLVATGAADIVKFEADMLRKDGSRVTIACGATPVYQEGRIAGTVLSVENITERRLAVEALKSAKEYTENLIRAACVMILGLDLKGKVTLFNRTGEEITGYSQEELTGKNWFETVMGAEAFFKMCGAPHPGTDGQGLGAFEGQIVTKAGAMRTISWRNSAIVEKGVRIGTLCFGIDITEHRKIEAQLRHSQKMESVGQLAGGVAHDFNNMLSVMLGYAQLGQLEAVQDSPMWTYLQEIIKAGERSRDMVRKLLAFSRKEIISPRAVNLNDHCLETEKTLSRLIGEEIRFSFIPDPDLWAVKIDPSQVDQILMNLAVNARDAMPEGGLLTIKTGNVVADEAFCDYRLDAKPGSYACLSVVDTGTGMDRELVKRIFEPFFTTKEVGRGTGLGLATVYGIVTQNGGFVDVESEPGHGTTFRIYLPKLTGEAVPSAHSAIAPLRGSGTVLVVEDDDMLRAMATQMLEKIGYRVIEAATPHAALSICGEPAHDIDLVLSDVIMPEMNGLEMARGIAGLRPETKVLFMTGYSSDIIAKCGMSADLAMHYIQKPFDMEGLHAKIIEMRSAC
ncbi:PAS domain S-box protein [Geomonas subterranea]|uniref:histidine kinase n=1 Tax=Geomonas subterranea TaxID=2847989 RepID=A0ABX8LLY0_9BACT|nr:PAS domain-containing sensor histidine kinase [Geomonas subterranea]QXE91921.1 PAS domain S-box protein [Geomonas subterranea]QXM09987.1 PAS domain S-box protein [Geomonas subterranea]